MFSAVVYSFNRSQCLLQSAPWPSLHESEQMGFVCLNLFFFGAVGLSFSYKLHRSSPRQGQTRQIWDKKGLLAHQDKTWINKQFHFPSLSFSTFILFFVLFKTVQTSSILISSSEHCMEFTETISILYMASSPCLDLLECSPQLVFIY